MKLELDPTRIPLDSKLPFKLRELDINKTVEFLKRKWAELETSQISLKVIASKASALKTPKVKKVKEPKPPKPKKSKLSLKPKELSDLSDI